MESRGEDERAVEPSIRFPHTSHADRHELHGRKHGYTTRIQRVGRIKVGRRDKRAQTFKLRHCTFSVPNLSSLTHRSAHHCHVNFHHLNCMSCIPHMLITPWLCAAIPALLLWQNSSSCYGVTRAHFELKAGRFCLNESSIVLLPTFPTSNLSAHPRNTSRYSPFSRASLRYG